MNQLFELITGQLIEFFKIRHIAILKLAPSEADLALEYSCGFREESVDILGELNGGLAVFGRLIETRIPQVVDDISQTEPALSTLAENEGLRSMIAVPLLSGKEVWGVLAAFSEEPHRFKEADAKIINLFAGQVSGLQELFSRHLRVNLDELLVQILGSVDLMNLRYRKKTSVAASEMLEEQQRLRNRVVPFVTGMPTVQADRAPSEEKQDRGPIVLPSGDELRIEEVVTIKGEENLAPKTKKVLVIDDQPMITDLLVSVLERMDYQSEVASSGRAGLEMFKKDRFDLVITDLGMPDVSGWDVSKAVKERNPKVPVVVITGWGVDPDQTRMKESRVDLIIYKPFQLDELEKTISGLLQR
jgi:CheY-like chemotaxis protein